MADGGAIVEVMTLWRFQSKGIVLTTLITLRGTTRPLAIQNKYEPGNRLSEPIQTPSSALGVEFRGYCSVLAILLLLLLSCRTIAVAPKRKKGMSVWNFALVLDVSSKGVLLSVRLLGRRFIALAASTLQ